MKNTIKNIGYFIREAKTMIGLNIGLNVISLMSTGLIFFIFALIVSGWQVSNGVVEAIQNEAEMNVYFYEGASRAEITELVDRIEEIEGVEAARIVQQVEAHERMEAILGQEAQVLAYFDDSPFQAFIEVKIQLEEIDPVLEKMNTFEHIESIRDNREILDRVQQLAVLFRFLGYVVLTAVGIATLVIISHMIRLGIYHSREQINTLRLLGAPEPFIGAPFLIEGLLLTLGGGLLAAGLGSFVIQYVYGQITGPLPFIPLPPLNALISYVVRLVILLSGVLGIAGSLIGLRTAKQN